jgi:membrane protease YdiL (CAAX protease family)
VWRAAEAVVVLGVLAALAVLLGATRGSLSLRWPARRWIRWAAVGFLVTGPVALLIGPLVARPFFGEVAYDVTVVGAVVPALVFAIANGVMEELIYRGALLGWTARVMGVGPALVGQAIVFGLAHSGPDVAGSPILLMVGLAVGGLLAGVIAVRTRSLLIPIAVHVGFDIPIYYAFACPA